MSDDEASILKISNIQLSDRGDYTCVAKSFQSEARTTASLNVEGIYSNEILLLVKCREHFDAANTKQRETFA